MTDRDDAGTAAWRAMLLAHAAALRAIDADLAGAKAIPLTWYDVLLELRAAPEGRLQMQELGRRVVLSRTRVSRLVDDMTRPGLVTKIRDSGDRRVVWATITAAGVRALRETAPLYLRGIETHFSAYLTGEEKAVLATALTKVAAAGRDGSATAGRDEVATAAREGSATAGRDEVATAAREGTA
ncbi:MAG TPA: helix-turn-helix domain-containing protein [Mycobacteriales bacterium]|nr:helix-turn-helix domain-containing protein [Mycobacteriales bacterium]